MHFHHFVCVHHLNSIFFFQFQVFFLNHLNLLFQELNHFHQGAASRALDSGSISVGQRSGITAAVHHVSTVRCWLALWAPGSVMDLTASNGTAEPLFSRPQSQHLPREGHHEGSRLAARDFWQHLNLICGLQSSHWCCGNATLEPD